jgi:hypothetical protein
MSLFKSDPAAALEKTRQKLVSVDENLASLRAKRAEVLLSAEDAGAVVSIDKAIDAEIANAAIYKDRCRALQEEIRKVTYTEREGRRTKAIAKIKERLKRREAVAADLQTAIEAVGRLYVQLTTSDEAESEWSFPRPGHGFAALDRRSVDKEIAWSLYGLTREHRVPEPSSVERAGLSTLNEGQTVEFEEVANKGKTSAENLKVAGR